MLEVINKMLEFLELDPKQSTEFIEQMISVKSTMYELLSKLRRVSYAKNQNWNTGEQLYREILDELAKLK